MRLLSFHEQDASKTENKSHRPSTWFDVVFLWRPRRLYDIQNIIDIDIGPTGGVTYHLASHTTFSLRS